MSTPQLSARDVRAAAEVHRDLGPEYSDAVVDSFLEKVDARLDARLAELTPVRKRPVAKASSGRRRSLLTGLALGGGGMGVLLSFLGYTLARSGTRHLWQLMLIASFGCLVVGFVRTIHDHD